MAQCLKTKTLFSQTIKNNFFFSSFLSLPSAYRYTALSLSQGFFLFLDCTLWMAFSKHHHTLTVLTTTISYCSSWSSYSRELAATTQEFGDQLLTQHSIQQFKQKILFYTIFHKQSSFLLHKNLKKKKKKEKKSHNLTIPKSCKTIKLYLPNPPFDNNTPIKNPNHYHVQASMSSGVVVEPKIFLICGFRVTN